jgi:hypothetical protein
MLDIETHLMALYMMSDGSSRYYLSAEASHPGAQASLSRSEVVTLAIFGQWSQFKSERGFSRSAKAHLLRTAFPSMPDRVQIKRLQWDHRDARVGFGLHLVQLLRASTDVYELLDSTASDPTGNTTDGNFYVVVKGVAAQLIDLLTLINSFCSSLRVQTLVTKLQVAFTAVNAGQTSTAALLSLSSLSWASYHQAEGSP